MSTKLYGGLRAHTTDALSLAHTIRESLAPIVERARQSQYGDDLTRVWDLSLRGLTTDTRINATDSPAVAAVLYRMDEDAHDDAPAGTNHGPLDWAVTVTEGRDDTTLLIVHAANDAYREALLTLPGIEDYAYWNNSDQPDGISDEQWAARRDDWERALGPDWVPANHGVSISTSTWGRGILTEHHDDRWVQGALDSQPSVRARLVVPLTDYAVRDVARDQLMQAVSSALFDVSRALQRADDEIIAALAPSLRPLTLADVRGPLPKARRVLDESAASRFLVALPERAA